MPLPKQIFAIAKSFSHDSLLLLMVVMVVKQGNTRFTVPRSQLYAGQVGYGPFMR